MLDELPVTPTGATIVGRQGRGAMSGAITAEGLVKHYGKVRALDGLDLEVPQGTVLGVLGPNGAGKTTCVRILTTLLTPDAGSASVAGIDVVRHPEQVRRVIGLSGQYAAVDEYLTGFENLDMVGRLYHLGRQVARARARELLDRFDLVEAADRPVKTYSGGMRRRLDLASALVARPPVLFLDEPTTGLDPRSRLGLWDVIEALVGEGTTLLLTTQYLEEADRLADDIAVIDHGRVIAQGTADSLKAQVGGERVQVVVAEAAQLPAAVRALAPLAVGEPVLTEASRQVTVPVTGGARVLVAAVRALDTEGVHVLDIGLRRPTLDDVFLSLTGHAAESAEPGARRPPPKGGSRTGGPRPEEVASR
jgi:ABC-2 type transport system ATP-binding protein